MPAPPVERRPIKDLRTAGGKGVRSPSPDPPDTIHSYQRRQDWYREYADQQGEGRIPFVGPATLDRTVEEVAETVRRELDYTTDARRECRDAAPALRLLVERAEATGVLVMVSGVVKNITSTRRFTARPPGR